MIDYARAKSKGGARPRGVLRESLPNKPLVSVITAVLNGKSFLDQTVQSVAHQTYDNVEYLVIDGGSQDGTLDIIQKYEEFVDFWVSEPDRGISDAMNKGIDLASGEWLIFMNAGDVFFDERALEKTIGYAAENVDLLYSDTWFDGTRSRSFICDHLRMRIIHQSLLYRKQLHEEAGKYLVGAGVTISDYIFFNLVAHKRWKKVDHVIAKCDDRGMSSRSWTLYQKLAVDLIFQSRGRLQVSALLALYPFYKTLKRLGLSFTRFGR